MPKLLVSIWLLAAAFLQAAPNPVTLDRIIEETRKAWNVPGIAVAIVQGDHVIYRKGFGVKRLGIPEPVTPDTRFAIGSTTKAFTTAAMGLLVDSGKMAWDDPVRKHIPFFRLADPLADANVTMRDIICHRTGLSRNDLLWIGSPFTREEIIRKIGLVPLTKPFRSAYQYQNIMFLTAGYAVGLIARAPWETVVRERLWKPLGMNNSDFSANDVIKSTDYSSPHEKRNGEVEVIPWRNIDNIAPAGSINSSVNDLARWVRMQLNEGRYEDKQILKPETLREMHSPQMAMRTDDPNSRSVNIGTNMMSYGLGWVIQDYRGHHMVSHGGAIDGFRAQVALLPNERYGIVILANLGGNNMPEGLRAAIADELLGLPAKDWNKLYLDAAKKQDGNAAQTRREREGKRHAGTKPSRELEAYAGEYTQPAYGVATVRLTGGTLQLHWSSWQIPLEHYHFDTFRAAKVTANALSDTLVEFHLNADGAVQTVNFIGQEFSRNQK